MERNLETIPSIIGFLVSKPTANLCTVSVPDMSDSLVPRAGVYLEVMELSTVCSDMVWFDLITLCWIPVNQRNHMDIISGVRDIGGMFDGSYWFTFCSEHKLLLKSRFVLRLWRFLPALQFLDKSMRRIIHDHIESNTSDANNKAVVRPSRAFKLVSLGFEGLKHFCNVSSR